jgi:AcrR family transcriptional regulator
MSAAKRGKAERAGSGDDARAPADRARRTYTKRARADKEAATRARILSATLELWAEHGPADTTITAVATRARVQRLTVYRHFADEAALTRAACQRFEESYPVPDPAEWATIDNPAKRLRRALRALYEYYRSAEPLLARVSTDERRAPALHGFAREAERYREGVLATLEAGWPVGRKRAARLSTAIALAIRLETWRCLAAAGLDPASAARLMERMVRSLTRKRPR